MAVPTDRRTTVSHFYREDSNRVFILYVMRAERFLRSKTLRSRDEDET